MKRTEDQLDDVHSPEIVVGLVYAVGTDTSALSSQIVNCFSRFRYDVREIRLTKALEKLKWDLDLPDEPEFERISSRMDAGNQVRELTKLGDAMARIGVNLIRQNRGSEDPKFGTVYVLRSFKHPREVQLMKRIYGSGFYLIGVYSSPKRRKGYLTRDKQMTEKQAAELMQRDEREANKLGQRMRDTFELADVFINVDTSSESQRDQLWRFFDVVYGKPVLTPNRDEHPMMMAYVSSLRSGELSRQVGAVVVSRDGELVSSGANEVPRAGGGTYWDGDKDDARDVVRGEDTNHVRREEILEEIIRITKPRDRRKARKLLEESAISHITEFGRAVHAEMDAILSCARSGISTRGATLFATTFPCHNCARHIVTAGISRVVYIEPYPKSKALELHGDAIDADGDLNEGESADVRDRRKVKFEPFVGVGPRRFIDLFSVSLGSGFQLERKGGRGKVSVWDEGKAKPRVPMLATSYQERELFALEELFNAVHGTLKSLKAKK